MIGKHICQACSREIKGYKQMKKRLHGEVVYCSYCTENRKFAEFRDLSEEDFKAAMTMRRMSHIHKMR